MPFIVAWLASALTFGLLDFLWLSRMFPRLYQPEIGSMLGDLRWGPALAFYVIYITGMQVFAVAPGIGTGKWTTALLMGALLGMLCYATYDLTNQATLKLWSMKVTIFDILWGGFATAMASAAGAAAALAFASRG